jgi:prolyl 4-hydroxylase
MVEIKNFITPEQCNTLIQICESKLENLKVLGSDNEDEYRKAEGTWIDKNDNDNNFISDMLVEVSKLPKENQESIHLVKYKIGGEYKNHHDFFHLNQSYTETELAKGGQRTKSCLIYLNDNFKGGETVFPTIDVKVAPEQGKLIIWDNLNPDGSLNNDSLHAGLPVEEGIKYIAIVWIRENKFIP